MIWKVLVPCLLKGYNPVWLSLGLVAVLTFLTLSLIYGWDKRCLAAFSGALSGILVTMVLGSVFTDLFQIHGTVMESSESLLYAGYQYLDLTQIFVASIFLGSAGAVMDLSVDICSAVYEVVCKKPNISAGGNFLRLFCWQSCLRFHHHNTAAGLLRQLYRLADGIYGSGNSCRVYVKLQICFCGDHTYHCWFLWTGDCCSADRNHQRIALHETHGKQFRELICRH